MRDRCPRAENKITSNRPSTKQDARSLIEDAGVTILTEKEREYELKVTGEEQANQLLVKLIGAGITVITFDLREPSLHEIFVEKVGEVNE